MKPVIFDAFISLFLGSPLAITIIVVRAASSGHYFQRMNSEEDTPFLKHHHQHNHQHRTNSSSAAVVNRTARAMSSSLPRQVAMMHHSHDHQNSYDHHNHHPQSPHQCRTYLAPSTIPGAGLGMFAGLDLKLGEEVTPGDVMVPIRDIAWHNDLTAFADQFLWGT